MKKIMFLTRSPRKITFRETLLYFLIYLIFFQDYIGLIIFNLQSSHLLVKCFLALKDMVLLFLLLIGLTTRRRFQFSPALICMSFYTAIVLVYYFILPGNSIYDLRSLLFPFFCMYAGYLFNRFDKDRFIYHLRIAAVLSTIIALCIYLGGPQLLIKWNLLAYNEQGRGFIGLITKELPSSFYSYFEGVVLFRLAAGIMHPIATASLLIFALAVLWSAHVNGKIKTSLWVYFVLLLAIFLTFSRGPIAGGELAFILGLLLWRKTIFHFIKQKFIWIGIILSLLIIVGGDTFIDVFISTINRNDASSGSHYQALIQSWKYINQNWFGAGVGASGQWKENDIGAAVENSYAMIIGQVGLFSFVLLIISYILILKKLLKYKKHFLSLGLFLSFVILLFNSFFSGALFSATPLMLFWFLVGYFEAHSTLKRSFPLPYRVLGIKKHRFFNQKPEPLAERAFKKNEFLRYRPPQSFTEW